MSKQKGMVLLATIMMLSLLAMLVVSQMQGVFLAYKSLNRLIEKHQAFYQLEVEARKLEATGWQATANCLVRGKHPNEIITLLKNKRGCSLSYDQQSFFYLVEDLGFFPCLQTIVNKKAYSTQHVRISILIASEQFAFLQMRIARTTKLLACENNPLIFINTGIISWRYLSS